MIRVNAVVEGQTEETFVRQVLAPHLGGIGVGMTARRVEFSRRKGHANRGGLVKYAKLKTDVMNWLNQESSTAVTTMVDFYALPDDFPGLVEVAKTPDPYQRIARLEESFAREIGSQRFIPYIQLHEFEALLFADITRLSASYPDSQSGIQNLAAQAAQFKTPELIDENNPPSKRIKAEIRQYQKVLAGTIAALDLGLPLIRSKCPHFDAWTSKLEKLAA